MILLDFENSSFASVNSSHLYRILRHVWPKMSPEGAWRGSKQVITQPNVHAFLCIYLEKQGEKQPNAV